MNPLMLEISRRLHHLYEALYDGSDVAPSTVLRLEGLMEAAILTEVADQDALDELLEECHAGVYQRSLTQEYGADWRRFYTFPQIPVKAQRAPVYPSTKSES